MRPSSGCTPFRVESVAGPSHRADPARASRVILQLLAQGGDVDVHDVVIAEIVVAPDALEELLAREYTAGCGGQGRQQSVLERCEGDLDARLENTVSGEVDGHLAEVL